MGSFPQKILQQFIRFGKKQSFQPNFFSIFLNPFFFIRRRLYKSIQRKAPELKGELLDFGCGRKPYRNLFDVKQYVGLDIEESGHPDHGSSDVDIYYDGKVIPVEDESFDSVFSSEVFEHIFNIDEILPEINRVLKKDGIGLITVPFVWNEHEEPYDYARYTSFGIKFLLEKHGFQVISQQKTGHFFEVLVQQFIVYLYSFFKSQNRILNTLLTVVFLSPFNILGFIIATVLPKNDKLYHNNVIVFKKEGPKITS